MQSGPIAAGRESSPSTQHQPPELQPPSSNPCNQWFVPLGNMIIPWLTVRDALKSLGKPTALAGGWWLTWLIVMPLTMIHGMARQVMIVPELRSALAEMKPDTVNKIFELTSSTFWPYFILDTGTWVLLLLIVSTIRKVGAPQR